MRDESARMRRMKSTCALPFTDKTLCSLMNVGYKWHFGNEEDKCNIGLLCFWTLYIL
jgi:hypothetical protein